MANKESMFSCSKNKGFQITFKNGVTVSVQFGNTNYCEHYLHYREGICTCSEDNINYHYSRNAEVAIFKGNTDHWLTRECPLFEEENDDVVGYITPDVLLQVLVWAAAYED